MTNYHTLFNETILHLLPGGHDIFGQPIEGGHTSHRARVTYTPGEILGPASGEFALNAAAMLWLVQHPRPIAIGDQFQLENGDQLEAARIETRQIAALTISKVYLK